jgi:transcriptional regulator
MYIPASFAETDPAALHHLMQRHSFATLVSQGEGEPFASHLPLLIEHFPAPHGRLLGHMARANPQWRSADGQRVLAIFHGPHAYVSPTWYEAANVVPTWNYAVVHAYGRLRLVGPERLREIVRRTVDRYESGRPAPWSMDAPDPAFVEKLLESIVGFEIDVDRLEGKWKLSQNHSAERREKVIHALQNAGDDEAQLVAGMMQQSLRG